jgi:hypothetical protein
LRGWKAGIFSAFSGVCETCGLITSLSKEIAEMPARLVPAGNTLVKVPLTDLSYSVILARPRLSGESNKGVEERHGHFSTLHSLAAAETSRFASAC